MPCKMAPDKLKAPPTEIAKIKRGTLIFDSTVYSKLSLFASISGSCDHEIFTSPDESEIIMETINNNKQPCQK
ncbi:hypothetical protein MASR2M47_17850 [Draconibacterium sp.]